MEGGKRQGEKAGRRDLRIGSSPRLYHRVFEILSAQIRQGVLAPPATLTETAVAARFGVSRAPARRALAELAEAGLLTRSASRGYVVAGGGSHQPARPSQQPPPAGTTLEDVPKLVSLPSWERIYGEVESEIIARISFATWRVNEAELARHYRVSRTVARDVLARLQQRGLVRKDDRARWYAPALTADHVGELYELRWILEPVALAKAAPNLPRDLLQRCRQALEAAMAAPEVSGATLDRLEHDLHVALLARCENHTLMQAITQPQSLLIAHRFLYRWTARLFRTEPFLPEHLEVVDALLAGQAAAAATALQRHLQVSRDRAIARIDVIARGTQPDPLSYLERMG
ncbi:GntR family transcriptional regulator [Chelativorans intermedius]|uniref:GntR family transcriptional regulator n=1 Tax=Chelativorans intermedius TaxID=515947 RepID=A0ABV6D5T1_9HYPH|nr:GntR family transcriptional regulator [Chelativorans intermedius]MCT8998879.1 GntR family transcriptional regulator [Chelativorans intermedius]